MPPRLPRKTISTPDAGARDLGGVDRQVLAACVEACFDRARTCTARADACLGARTAAELVRLG